jgi:hypothetical protein
LLPRYDLRNPSYFVEQLNQHLGRSLQAYKNAYLLDIDQIASSIGRRYIQDDSTLTWNHGSLSTNYVVPQDRERLEKLPAVHEAQTVQPAVAENVPAAQATPLDSPVVAQYEPNPQATTLDIPVAEQKLPARQGWETVRPVALQNEPVGHAVANDIPVLAQKYPTGHAMKRDKPEEGQ